MILSCGSLLYRAVQASDMLRQRGIHAGVMNVSCPKDIDESALRTAARTGLLITYEDHNVHTGLGTIIADAMIRYELHVPLIKLGVSAYGISGSPDDAYRAAGLDVEQLVRCLEQALSKKSR
jgi:transketolase